LAASRRVRRSRLGAAPGSPINAVPRRPGAVWGARSVAAASEAVNGHSPLAPPPSPGGRVGEGEAPHASPPQRRCPTAVRLKSPPARPLPTSAQEGALEGIKKPTFGVGGRAPAVRLDRARAAVDPRDRQRMPPRAHVVRAPPCGPRDSASWSANAAACVREARLGDCTGRPRRTGLRRVQLAHADRSPRGARSCASRRSSNHSSRVRRPPAPGPSTGTLGGPVES